MRLGVHLSQTPVLNSLFCDLWPYPDGGQLYLFVHAYRNRICFENLLKPKG